MPTPREWTRRAAAILLDERNKRYLGMTDPTGNSADPSGLRAALERLLEAGRHSTDEGYWDAVDKARAALAATPPVILDPATEATRGTPTGQRDQAANHKEPLSPAHFTPPASGPLTSGSNEPEGLDVERLAQVFFTTTVLGTMFLPEARRLAERINAEYARLTAATSASSQEAEA